MCNKYNGYTNYETWAMSLYIDGNYTDQSTYQYFIEETKRIVLTEEYPNAMLQDLLKEHIDEFNPLEEDSSIYVDLLQSAIDNVNWYELAKELIDYVNENYDIEEEKDVKNIYDDCYEMNI